MKSMCLKWKVNVGAKIVDVSIEVWVLLVGPNSWEIGRKRECLIVALNGYGKINVYWDGRLK